MTRLRRAQGCVQAGPLPVATLRRAQGVAADETGVRIEGSNADHWGFRCKQAAVHHAAPTWAASVVRAMMAGHQPEVWLSDRSSAQQGHAAAPQTCLAHRARASCSAKSPMAIARGGPLMVRPTSAASSPSLA